MWAIEAKKYVYEPIIAAMKTASEKAQRAAKEHLTREKFNQGWQLATEKSSRAKEITTKKFDPAVNFMIGQLNQVFFW